MYTNILVTGGCGFIGSNFIIYMLDKYPKINIFNIDRVDYCSNPDYVSKYTQENRIDRYRHIKGDITDKLLVLTALVENNIDAIVHFAAQSHVDNSFGNSLQFTVDNILGTHTLLECSRIYGKLTKFVHISTDEVYGEVDMEHKGCDEKSLLNPTNPYAATKAGAEFLVKSYFHSYRLPVVITRGNNVFGPNQYPEKLIPRFITRLLKSEKCPVQGNGLTRRNFIFTEDVSSAVDKILQQGEINRTYNIGCCDEYSVLDILRILVKKILDRDDYENFIDYVPDRPFNDFRYKIDYSNLTEIGWQQTVEFEDGINRTIQWYKSNC
jgi:dTDP-glucose 4,6-dehydratase